MFDSLNSFVSTLARSSGEDDGGEIEGRFAALYPEGDAPSEGELRDELLTDDADVELHITIAQDRVYAAAQGSEETID